MSRSYHLQRRAEKQFATRQRIVAAAVELHRTVGPARTHISDVAKLAGVERATVYRHFPDAEQLFAACSQHFRALHPPPDPTSWTAIVDPEHRLRTGLRATYTYYREHEGMVGNVLRDSEVLPVGGGFLAYAMASTESLAGGWQATGRQLKRIRATVALTVAFTTWQQMVRQQGLRDHELVDLAVHWVAAAYGT